MFKSAFILILFVLVYWVIDAVTNNGYSIINIRCKLNDQPTTKKCDGSIKRPPIELTQHPAFNCSIGQNLANDTCNAFQYLSNNQRQMQVAWPPPALLSYDSSNQSWNVNANILPDCQQNTTGCCKLQNNNNSKVVDCKQKCENIGLFGSNRSCFPASDTSTWTDEPLFQPNADQRYIENLPEITIPRPTSNTTSDYYCICSSTNDSTSQTLVESVTAQNDTDVVHFPRRNPHMRKILILFVGIFVIFATFEIFNLLTGKHTDMLWWAIFDLLIIVGLQISLSFDKRFNQGRCLNFLRGEATASQLYVCNNPAYYSTLYDLRNQLNDARVAEGRNREVFNRESAANINCATRLSISGGQDIQYVCPDNQLCDADSEGMVVRNCLCKQGSWILPSNWSNPTNSCTVDPVDQQDVNNRCDTATQNGNIAINYKGRRCICNSDGTLTNVDQYTGQMSRQSNSIGERFFCPPLGHAIDEGRGTSTMSEQCWCNANQNNIGRVFSTGQRFNCECSSTPLDGNTTGWVLTDKPATPNFQNWDASLTTNCGNQECNFTESTSQYLNPRIYFESGCTEAGIPTAIQTPDATIPTPGVGGSTQSGSNFNLQNSGSNVPDSPDSSSLQNSESTESSSQINLQNSGSTQSNMLQRST